jgi:hypothetical protein
MKPRRCIGRLIFSLAAIVGLSWSALAQQNAEISGTVTDQTGAVIPGVTVTVTDTGSGAVFKGITDEVGQFHFLALRASQYTISAELAGFATLTKQGFELLVGQQARINLTMQPATVAQEVEVTSAAPLVETTVSQVASNIDPRQMQELPINGRNWLDLTVFAPGARATSVTEAPLPRDNGSFQLNMDGQEITSTISASSFGSSHYARDSIAEFQFVTNRFDATQGRSGGVQVNAVTKSGTNSYHGSAYGYFRDQSLNAADFVAQRVLPYSDQQWGGTIGGPIKRERAQFFFAYEGERQPQTYVWTSPYPYLNTVFNGINTQRIFDGRVDLQGNANNRFYAHIDNYHNWEPCNPVNCGLATQALGAAHTEIWGSHYFGVWDRILSNKTTMEVKGGYHHYHFFNASYETCNCPFGNYSPTIQLQGVNIGNPSNYPELFGENRYSVRFDLENIHGKHELKFGGEYLHNTVYATWPLQANGILTANAKPVDPALLPSIFPNLSDPASWNLALLSPITTQWQQAFGPNDITDPEQISAYWFQDNWSATSRLNLNLGLRYDLDIGVFKPHISIPPFLVPGQPGYSNGNDYKNWGPRAGFALKLDSDGSTVLRGGYGLYFEQVTNNQAHDTVLYSEIASVFIQNDGRPDFASNPYNGKIPTYAQAKANYPQTIQIYAPGVTSPYAHQANLGVQRQITPTQAMTVEFVYTGSRRDWNVRNANLAYNPATGTNYPFTSVALRPYPDWGVVKEFFSDGLSNYEGLNVSWEKRFSAHWQASATYTVSRMYDTCTPYSSTPDNSFRLGGEYAPSTGDQRHRATANIIWALPHGFQVSGAFFYGSGFAFNNVWGGDLRNTGNSSSGRLKPDGTIVPRNSFYGLPVQKVDTRVTKSIPLFRETHLDVIAELFNVFNHANYGSYFLTQSVPSSYGHAAQNTDLAYQPRMAQLAVHFVF